MYLLFSDLYDFWIMYEIKSVASLYDTRPAPVAAGTLIGDADDAGHLELVEADLPNLCSCATPVLPELGGKAGEKPPRSGHRWSRLDTCTSPSEVIVVPPVVARHLAESPLLLRGLGRENNKAANSVRLTLMPQCHIFSCPMPLFRLFPSLV
jgi:hypothetical protein